MTARLTDEELDEASRVAESMHSLRLVAVCSELKERRALDAKTMPTLTEEERETLGWVHALISGSVLKLDGLTRLNALLVLARLLATKEQG